MSNFKEYEDVVAFHPGYYVEEIIDASKLTQKDFSIRLDTTEKNLSELIHGNQNLSVDMAIKLSRMMGTSVEYWLRLQNRYDTIVKEHEYASHIEEEKDVFKCLDYKYFRDNFGLPSLTRDIIGQIAEVRKFLNVSSLTVLEKRDLAVSFRQANTNIKRENMIKANAMVQIATKEAVKADSCSYDKNEFRKAVEYALTLTQNEKDSFELIRSRFLLAGVVLVILPNISGSKTNGATKKLDDRIVLMVNDRRMRADTFWFTLFHEIGHIVNKDFGVSFESEIGDKEERANRFAEDKLIPRTEYEGFVSDKSFDVASIRRFADRIHRNPGIVLGRLQNDGIVGYADRSLNELRHRYEWGR